MILKIKVEGFTDEFFLKIYTANVKAKLYRPTGLLFCLFLCGFGWELCRTAISALCHCPLYSEWGWPSDNQSSQHALLRCSWPWKYSLTFMPQDWWNWEIKWIKYLSMESFKYKNQENGEFFLHTSWVIVLYFSQESRLYSSSVGIRLVCLENQLGQEFHRCHTAFKQDFVSIFRAV